MDLHLEILTEQFLEWARELHNDPEVLSVLTDTHVVSKEEQLLWYNKISTSSNSKRMVVLKDDNTPIGIFRLDSIDTANKSVCVGLDIHKDFRGCGYAKKVYKIVLDEWLGYRGFNRAWLTTASYNIRAISLYTKLGFKEEGVLRETLFRDGVFYDCVLMSLLSREYKSDKTNTIV